jgi:hypothetical protein
MRRLLTQIFTFANIKMRIVILIQPVTVRESSYFKNGHFLEQLAEHRIFFIRGQ